MTLPDYITVGTPVMNPLTVQNKSATFSSPYWYTSAQRHCLSLPGLAALPPP
jgi:hypothetical protein